MVSNNAMTSNAERKGDLHGVVYKFADRFYIGKKEGCIPKVDVGQELYSIRDQILLSLQCMG